MNLLRRGIAGLFFVGLAQACASGSDGVPVTESVGTSQQAITTACSFNTLGMPCDPDGPAGPKLECEGYCGIAISGYVTCAPTTVAGQMNGIVCGTSTGVGDAACRRYCSGKSCLAADAPAGAGCRPNAASTPCDGQCNGSGKCEAVASPCAFGRQDQLCKQDTCNLANATQCLTKNLPKNTICSDSDACSIGKCSAAGACVPGPTVGCNDGNDCTDDTCDPDSGGCIGVNDDTNTCSDGNACTTGEHCGSGACIPGTTPVDCDDHNECTSDSCDPNTGCAHILKSCNDGNACTADSCDPLTGGCVSALINCADADPCTIDDCDTAKGCTHVLKACDDADACTADSCTGGNCDNTPISCDDGDPCTEDSCNKALGCEHVLIPGCGTGGTGSGGTSGSGGTEAGGSSGSAGTDSGGTGGTAANGGSDVGGTSGTAGTDAGGVSGTGGTDTGGTAGTSAGGTSASGGTGTAGTSGNGGSDTGGTSATAGAETGGTSDSGGTAGTNGDAGAPLSAAGEGPDTSGGSTAAGGRGGSASGGLTSTPGGDASTDGGTAAAGASNDGGCGCRVASPRRGGVSWALGALIGLVVLRRRRSAA